MNTRSTDLEKILNSYKGLFKKVTKLYNMIEKLQILYEIYETKLFKTNISQERKMLTNLTSKIMNEDDTEVLGTIMGYLLFIENTDKNERIKYYEIAEKTKRYFQESISKAGLYNIIKDIDTDPTPIYISDLSKINNKFGGLHKENLIFINKNILDNLIEDLDILEKANYEIEFDKKIADKIVYKLYSIHVIFHELIHHYRYKMISDDKEYYQLYNSYRLFLKENEIIDPEEFATEALSLVLLYERFNDIFNKIVNIDNTKKVGMIEYYTLLLLSTNRGDPYKYGDIFGYFLTLLKREYRKAYLKKLLTTYELDRLYNLAQKPLDKFNGKFRETYEIFLKEFKEKAGYNIGDILKIKYNQ
jgi:hypothetical protein